MLHLADRVTYGALFNSLNSFKPRAKTNIVEKYTFWNEDLANRWLNDADIVLLEENKLKIISDSSPLSNLDKIINKDLKQNYKLINRIEDFWPSPLLVFKRFD